MNISKEQVEKIINIDMALSAAFEAFYAYGAGKVDMPPKQYLYLPKGDFRTMFGSMTLNNGKSICGTKWVNVHPENHKVGLPTVMARIILNDPETGEEICTMDGTAITNYRTGAAAAIATQYLTNVGFGGHHEKFCIIGAGEQAFTQILALEKMFFLSNFYVFDINQEKTKILKERLKNFGVEITVCKDIFSAVEYADVVCTNTPSRKPVFTFDHLQLTRMPLHINAIGADAKGKKEIETDVVKTLKVFVDDCQQASHSGEINTLTNKITDFTFGGTLGKFIYDWHTGKFIYDWHTEPCQSCQFMSLRSVRTENTMFDSTGLVIQDLALAYMVYEKYING
ncbi:MAG: ornithine cyclodeaminase family protein [Atribacterota bacterium]